MEVDFGYLKDFKYRYPKRKLYSLMDKVYDLRTLEEAWERVRKNNGCAGIDEMTINEFQSNKDKYLQQLHRELKTGRYNPPPVLRKYIPKKDGKLRPLGIPTIKDRVVQQAVKMVLEPIFEMNFLDCSYGYRQERNAHQAMKLIDYYRTQKNHRWLLDGDIKGFFDNVNHEIMIKLVSKEISDGIVLELITKWLKAGVMGEGMIEETKIGTPQGGVISPLLANIYLHEMDKHMMEQKFNYYRYADDFIVVCSTKERAEKALKEVKKAVKKLKLQLHPEKTKIIHLEETEFLGFKFGGGFRGMKPRDKAVEKFKAGIKEFTRRYKTIAVKDIMIALNRVINGWGHYYKIGQVKVVFEQLDIYIRRRIRIYIEKKISGHSRQRLSNYTLFKEYGLKSLSYLLKLYQQDLHPV